jgi:hypothetical protein
MSALIGDSVVSRGNFDEKNACCANRIGEGGNN